VLILRFGAGWKRLAKKGGGGGDQSLQIEGRETPSLRSTAKDKGVLKFRRYFAARGLSCSVGELVEALAMREEWAQVMFASIKMRIEEQASERPTCCAQS
jgi:hypothetical protein